MRALGMGALVLAVVTVLGASAVRAADEGAWAKMAQEAWGKLKAGDWAKYKSEPTPGIELQMKWTVKEATDTKVTYTIESTTLMNGNAVAPPTSAEQSFDKQATIAAGAASAQTPGTTVSEETATVGGKSVPCLVMTAEAGGQTSKTWMSAEVPFGIVKVEANGKVAQELVEWGSGQ